MKSRHVMSYESEESTCAASKRWDGEDVELGQWVYNLEVCTVVVNELRWVCSCACTGTRRTV